jgi:demethylmenaquinone methyltransferase/2-methoxy-6-polyprenyl-1,4-benzoquinol methylase
MFTAIAPHYDLLNHLLSANVDKYWWRRTAATFSPLLSRPNARVLDLCCGTGDMTFALRGTGSQAQITGADFSHAMLKLALKKSDGVTGLKWIEADALQLPFADESFDLLTSAFGFRNLADYDAGLREIHRVLKPGGQFGILEFSEPKGTLETVRVLLRKQVLPRIGGAGFRHKSVVVSSCIGREISLSTELASRMTAVGFRKVEGEPYTFGIAGLYRGTK